MLCDIFNLQKTIHFESVSKIGDSELIPLLYLLKLIWIFKSKGRIPKLIRLERWIRAYDLARMALIPRYMGAMAACPRLEPWP